MSDLVIKYSENGDLAFSLVEHKGISYWSTIAPQDIAFKRAVPLDAINDVAKRRNERASKLIDMHIDMCEFFGYSPFQGEYWERNGWHSSDKDFCYLNICKWVQGEICWNNVPVVSNEDMERYRKSKKKQLELF